MKQNNNKHKLGHNQINTNITKLIINATKKGEINKENKEI